MTQLNQNAYGSKQKLAKLLAGENINVIVSNTHTAYFNLESRTLAVPYYVDGYSEAVYDMFTAHEVGHALWTPQAGWHRAIDTYKGIKSFMNIVEDVRIERKIQIKYPGLRPVFLQAYKELNEDGWFGNYKSSDMMLIDRLNVYAKVGAASGITFSAKETPLVDAAFAADTWEDVMAATLAIYEYCKTEREERAARHLIPNATEQEFTPPATEEDEEEPDIEEPEDEEDQEDVERPNETPAPDNGEGELVAVTDAEFKMHESVITKSGNTLPYTYEIPDISRSLSDFVVEWKETISLMKFGTNTALEMDKYKQVTAKMDPYVKLMVSQFNLKKNAKDLARTKTSKVGLVDTKKLSKYKLSDDIFRSIEEVQQGKNHGLLISLDWSGSVAKYTVPMVEQVIMMTEFCNKLNIPYSVMMFSSQAVNAKPKQNKRIEAINKINSENSPEACIFQAGGATIEVLSSDMPSAVYKMMVGALVRISSAIRNPYYNMPYSSIFRLGDTPMNEHLLVLRHVIDAFKQKHGVDLVKSVIVTDGVSGWVRNSVNPFQKKMQGVEFAKAIKVVDKKTKEFTTVHVFDKTSSFNCIHQTKCLLKLIQTVTGCEIVGYFLSSSLKKACYELGLNSESITVGDSGIFETKALGYSVMRIMKISKLNAVELEEVEKNKIRGAFIKAQRDKHRMREFVLRFARGIGETY